MYVAQGIDVSQIHVYGSCLAYGLVCGPSDDAIYPIRFHYDRMIIKSVMIGAWFRKTCFVMGGEIGFHDISQHTKFTSLHPMDEYPPVCIIESGGDATNRKIPSDYGFIKVYNYITSSSVPTIGFSGA